MRTQVIIIDPECKYYEPIHIGRQGENDVFTLIIDISSLIEQYGEGYGLLAHQRVNDYAEYPVITTREENNLSWVVKQADTRDVGIGRLQLTWMVNNQIAKTMVFKTVTDISIGNNQIPPLAWQAWINQVAKNADICEKAVSHYPKILNGNWWVWDISQGEFVDTGVSAEGLPGQGVPEVTVADVGKVATVDSTGKWAAETPAVVDSREDIYVEVEIGLSDGYPRAYIYSLDDDGNACVPNLEKLKQILGNKYETYINMIGFTSTSGSPSSLVPIPCLGTFGVVDDGVEDDLYYLIVPTSVLTWANIVQDSVYQVFPWDRNLELYIPGHWGYDGEHGEPYEVLEGEGLGEIYVQGEISLKDFLPYTFGQAIADK